MNAVIINQNMSKIEHFKIWGSICPGGGGVICPGVYVLGGKCTCPGGKCSEGTCPGGGGSVLSPYCTYFMCM